MAEADRYPFGIIDAEDWDSPEDEELEFDHGTFHVDDGVENDFHMVAETPLSFCHG